MCYAGIPVDILGWMTWMEVQDWLGRDFCSFLGIACLRLLRYREYMGTVIGLSGFYNGVNGSCVRYIGGDYEKSQWLRGLGVGALVTFLVVPLSLCRKDAR